jgi:hypothetical protein
MCFSPGSRLYRCGVHLALGIVGSHHRGAKARVISEFLHSTIPLIELKNIEKVFLTDGVETHPLSAVDFEIHHGATRPRPQSRNRFHFRKL